MTFFVVEDTKIWLSHLRNFHQFCQNSSVCKNGYRTSLDPKICENDMGFIKSPSKYLQIQISFFMTPHL